MVREDPTRKGLLYAGTEYGMYVSLDDGRRWRSLRLNLPAVPVTDISVHDGDLVLSTNGRSFWILDDVTPLREMAAKAQLTSHLFQPRDTYRIATSVEENDQPYVGGECCVSNPRDLYTGARIERHQLGEDRPTAPSSTSRSPTGEHEGRDSVIEWRDRSAFYDVSGYSRA